MDWCWLVFSSLLSQALRHTHSFAHIHPLWVMNNSQPIQATNRVQTTFFCNAAHSVGISWLHSNIYSMIAMCLSSIHQNTPWNSCLACTSTLVWTVLSVDRFSISSEVVYRLPVSPLISFYLNHFKLSNRQSIQFTLNVCLSTIFNWISNIRNTPGPSDKWKGMRDAIYVWNMNHPAFLPISLK